MRADAEGQTALRLRQGAQRAEKLDRAVPGRFVTGMERQEAQREAKVCGVLASFDGGWDDAERVQVCFHPDGVDAEFTAVWLEISWAAKFARVGHSDLLGSLMALGSGKLTGEGLFHGTQTQSEYSSALPNRHTDFIFTVIGEELGMVGCLLTLALLTAIVVRCIWVARHAKTRQEGLVCIGVAGMVIFQVIVNVGMCLFVMPVIGLTLPFISYGGSSILFLLIEMGLVMSVARGIKVRDV